MKKLSIFVLVLMFGLFLTGCGNSKEEKKDSNESGSKQYKEKLDSGATMTVYDDEGNIIDEDGFIETIGYVVDEGKDLVTISYEKNTNELVVTGKKTGDVKITIYYFDEDDECLSETSLRLSVDNNLNVYSSGFSGGFGTCTEDVENITVLN